MISIFKGKDKIFSSKWENLNEMYINEMNKNIEDIKKDNINDIQNNINTNESNVIKGKI